MGKEVAIYSGDLLPVIRRRRRSARMRETKNGFIDCLRLEEEKRNKEEEESIIRKKKENGCYCVTAGSDPTGKDNIAAGRIRRKFLLFSIPSLLLFPRASLLGFREAPKQTTTSSL